MSETVVETAPVASTGDDAVTNADIEQRHRAFVEETLAAEMEPALTFNSAQEAFDAIFSVCASHSS
ncbi:MAG: hypothetical protein HQK99_11090 [Nitrospirae bacterium]|nr:hypothetical protein [Nitrospirota bacterium]